MFDIFDIFFYPPKFQDQRKTRTAAYLSAILNITVFVFIVLIFSGEYLPVVNVLFGVLALFSLGMHFVLHSGRVTLAASLFILVLWLAMTYLSWVGNGLRDFGIFTYIILIFLANLMGNARLSFGLAALSLGSIWALYYAELQGYFTPVASSLLADALTVTVIILIFVVILYLTISDFENSLRRSEASEKELLRQNEDLRILQEGLAENSKILESTSEDLRIQALRLQTISSVVQQIILTRNTEELLPEIIKLTSERFDFYYIGIYLTSTDKRYIKLETANRPAEEMDTTPLSIDLDHKTIVAQVAYDRIPRIALDVGDKPTVFNNPKLPETRSEMALPLIYRSELLGVLDVQSKKEAAFDESDLETFSVLSGQISIAIENARQFERAQKALEETEEVSRQYLRQEWARLRERKNRIAYRYQHGKVEEIPEEKLSSATENGYLRVPVNIREETIGFLQIRANNEKKKWQQEEIELLQTVADRVALAIENARLLEDTTLQASKEGALSQFADTISNISQTDKLMSVAVRELQKILGATEVSFELEDL